MIFVYAVLGGLVGLALGGPAGGLVLLIITPVVMSIIRSSRSTPASTPPMPDMLPDLPDEAPAAPPELAQRVAALERELAALKLQVAQLSGAAAAQEVIPEPLPLVPPVAPALAVFEFEPVPQPVPVAQPVREAVVEESTGEPEPSTWTEPSRANPPPPPVPPVPPAPPVPLRDRLPPFVARWLFGGNTIVKVGVLILFLGLAFLLRYVAERATLPIEVRYAGVALVGVVLLVLGWRLRGRRDAAGGQGYGLILQGAGIGVFYLTALAALRLSALLPPAAAFGVMAVVALLGAALAVLQNAPWLAYVSVAEGFLAPVLVSTGGGNHVALFSYLAVLDVGIFLMAWHKAWRPLNLVGFVGTFTLAGAWAKAHYTDALYPESQAFLLLFFVLFTAIGVLFARRALALGDDPPATDSLSRRAAQALQQVGRVDSALVFGVPLAAFSLQYLMVKDSEWGPAWSALGFAFFYLVIGGALLRSARIRYALLGEAYVIVGAIFATLAIPLALEGAWTGATWAVEAAGMFWLGVRQHRKYTRAFALAVLAGAAVRLATSLDIDLHPGTPLLTGSLMGLLLLLGSVLAMWRVHHRHPAAQRAGWERWNDVALPWLAVVSMALIAWTVLLPLWAGVVVGLLGAALAAAGQRFALRVLAGCAAGLHLVALAGLAGSLHLDQDGAPRDGWPGLVAALAVGLSLLLTAWFELRVQLKAMDEREGVPRWSLAGGAALLAGLAVVALGLLCVLPAEQAALVWPWLGVGALALGLRIAHPALVLGWLALQLAAAVATLVFGPDLFDPLQAFGLRFWLPLGLGLAGLLAGDALQRAARPASAAALAWSRHAVVQWGIVLWALAWWVLMLVPEVLHLLQRQQAMDGWPAALVGCVAASSVLAALVAQWRDWRVMGQATAFTLPSLAVIAIGSAAADGAAPSAHLGWIAWPVALLWHLLLARRQVTWLPWRALQAVHVLGLWLFVALAGRECALWLGDAGEPGSAWRVLGWVPPVALVLFAMTRPAVLRRWPLAAFHEAYLVVGAAPLAIGLLLWGWLANAHPGSAAPLPFVPLLNPLEVGLLLALLVLALWWRALPEPVRAQVPREAAWGVFGLSAFALYTGMVLRLVHHAAGVPWEEQALFDSTLAQATLSVAWSLVGVGLMLLGHRRVHRTVWIVGAALLGVVVLKLFFVELADRGGLYRIVSFIVVGVLLLVVGYFAPVPPRRAAAPEEGEVVA